MLNDKEIWESVQIQEKLLCRQIDLKALSFSKSFRTEMDFISYELKKRSSI